MKIKDILTIIRFHVFYFWKEDFNIFSDVYPASPRRITIFLRWIVVMRGMTINEA